MNCRCSPNHRILRKGVGSLSLRICKPSITRPQQQRRVSCHPGGRFPCQLHTWKTRSICVENVEEDDRRFHSRIHRAVRAGVKSLQMHPSVICIFRTAGRLNFSLGHAGLTSAVADAAHCACTSDERELVVCAYLERHVCSKVLEWGLCGRG